MPGLAPWPITISMPSAMPQVVEVEHVPGRRHLIDEACWKPRRSSSSMPPSPVHVNDPDFGSAVAQGRLGRSGQRPKRHRGDVDGDVEIKRLGDEAGSIAQHGLGCRTISR